MRYLKISVIVSLVAAAAGLLGFGYLGHKLTAAVPAQIGAAPEWLGASSVAFDSASGSRIRGWLAIAERPKGSVVLLHGVRGNRRAMLSRARFLIAANYSVLMIDLQGHGESEGDRITFGHLESFDVAAAVEFMRGQTGSGSLVVLGYSLGGAAALLARPALPIDGLIVEAVYPDIEIAVRNRLRIRIGDIADFVASIFMNQLSWFVDVEVKDLKPMHHAPGIQYPVFVVSGALDQRTTVDDTKLLYDSLTGVKDVWLVAGAGHQNLHAFAGVAYEEKILAFISGISSDADSQN
ncbi:MAG: alpha/beta fold hydrolase [Pseudomonadota bacterium]